MIKFRVANIHCENCANTIKNALEDEFGEIKVDLSVEPRVISADITEDLVEKFKTELDELGFSVIERINA
jgi:heavy metal-associated domain protein